MAVPEIVNVIPATGPTMGGTLVEVYGRNFRMPPAPDAIPGGEVPETVEVRFGGVKGSRVEVISPIKLRVIAPIATMIDATQDGPFDVDLVITNLDDLGDPIPGETVTRVAGFRFARPSIDALATHDLTRAVRAVLVAFMRGVLKNTVLTVHTEYDSSSGDTLRIADIPTLPAIALIGPDIEENRFYSVNEITDVEKEDGTFAGLRVPYTVDLLFDVIGLSDSTMELLNLASVAMQFMQRTPWLELARDPSDASKGTVRYEFDIVTAFGVTSQPSESNVRTFSGRIVLRGVDLESLPEFALDAEFTRSVMTTDDPVILDVDALGG